MQEIFANKLQARTPLFLKKKWHISSTALAYTTMSNMLKYFKLQQKFNFAVTHSSIIHILTSVNLIKLAIDER